MVQIIKPPGELPDSQDVGWGVFLAGSIEMGAAEDWQKRVERHLMGAGLKSIVVFNPRRDDWDSSWEQAIENDNFREQVEWELDALDLSDLIILYLSPGTKSPISLLELGLYADSGKLLVCCPKEFWRRGNVEIVCKRYNIDFFETLDELLESL